MLRHVPGPATLRTAAWLLLLLGASLPARADWPERPIQLIFPSATGGIASDFSRYLAEELAQKFGQPVVVVDRPGAGGLVGFQAVRTAKPDGYTLLIGNNPLAILPLITKSAGYSVKDFAPVSLAVIGTNLIVVPTESPIKTFADLRSQSKAKAKGLSYASAGIGTTFQLSGAWFDSLNGSEMIHVPYKGGVPAIMSLLGGETSVMFGSLSSLPYVQSGKLRALALMSAKRSPFAPDVPTTAELGMPEFVVETFYGVLAPAGTPKDITDKLEKAITEVMNGAPMKEKLKTLLLQPSPDFSSGFFAKRLTDESVRWKKVIDDHDIRTD